MSDSWFVEIYSKHCQSLTKWWSYSVEGLLSTGPTPSSYVWRPAYSSKHVVGAHFSLYKRGCVNKIEIHNELQSVFILPKYTYNQLN